MALFWVRWLLGGNLSSMAMVSDDEGYVVVLDASFANVVKRFGLGMQSVSAGLSGLSGGFVPSLGVFGGRLYVLDQGSFADPAAVGVRVYDVKTDELVAGPISTGLLPSTIAFEGSVADFNGDCVVDFSDFLAFASAFGKIESDAMFDLDGNGSVDFSDFLIFVLEFEGE